ncbi:MAG TPA: ribokinase [Armatimonadota bacterium]|nr:ribokinase [Armatimonadota bacterium]
MMDKSKLLVIGSTNTDMVVEASSLPVPGQTVLGGSFRMTPGGKGANQAVAAARNGADVTFITALGDDNLGTESLARFSREGINTSHISIKHGVPTGVALILIDAQGENMIAVAPGANGELQPDDLVKAAPAFYGTKLLIMQLEIPLSSVIWAAEYAKKLGCPVLLNPAPMPPEGLPEELLQHVDVLTPNEGELMGLAPGSSSLEAAAASVLARGPKTLVVTRGRHGATVFTNDGSFHVPAFPITAVDTVGAGDCFSASLGVALAEGKALNDAVKFAAAAAALSTTVHGAQSAMPTREMVEQFITSAGTF